MACDVRGYRLGYGAGYYDRMLSKAEWKDKPTIGVVFEYAPVTQRAPRCVGSTHDFGVCTESGLFLASKR